MSILISSYTQSQFQYLFPYIFLLYLANSDGRTISRQIVVFDIFLFIVTLKIYYYSVILFKVSMTTKMFN